MAAEDRFERAACELLRALRGKRSQIALARRLGYRGNPITDWEHGRRYPTAAETLRVAAHSKLDLETAFAPFRPAPPPDSRSGYRVAEWLESLRGSTLTADLARRAERSRFRVARWLSGQSAPRLPDFLRLLDAITGRTAEWVAALVPIEAVPSLQESYVRVSRARRLATELPWSEAVMRVMETRAYLALTSHHARYVASVLGIGLAEVDEVTKALHDAGIVESTPRGARVVAPLVVDTKGDPAGAARLRQHWADIACRRVELGDEDWFAYNVISVSEKDCARIEERLRAAYREVRGIVRESEPCEQAALLTIQLVRWRPDPSESPALESIEAGDPRPRPRP